MAGKIIESKKWMPLKEISVKIMRITESGIYVRVFGTIELNKEKHTYDMFPFANDFFVSNGGSLNISESDDFKMEATVEVH